jgi:hypothetical protein
MASGDELRDYRILFRWCIPAVEALSAVHDGDRPPVAAFGNRDHTHDRDAVPATLIHPTTYTNQQVRALNFDESRRETTALPWRIPPWARGNAPVITVVITGAHAGNRARSSNWSKRPQGQIRRGWPENNVGLPLPAISQVTAVDDQFGTHRLLLFAFAAHDLGRLQAQAPPRVNTES